MSEQQTVIALAALAQPQRLRAFRALVVAGPAGLSAGVLAQQLDIAPSALSFHLKELSHAGLVAGTAQGRFIIYQARFNQMNQLLAYLSEHCCQGEDCGTTATSGCAR
ncbi:ArsR/SmtB family transcription factor [Hydrogenophaga sp. OTU3427]|uniref:ArsR/SmtB family transcription factor n=1 Tax=Hydrogenophaga sp. OTU3427 TaxID=3043856 RepID=UPI00313D4EC8